MTRDTRAEAYSAVKLAIRAYSRDPSANNAVKVEEAWQLVRTLDAVSAWRHRPSRSFQPFPSINAQEGAAGL